MPEPYHCQLLFLHKIEQRAQRLWGIDVAVGEPKDPADLTTFDRSGSFPVPFC